MRPSLLFIIAIVIAFSCIEIFSAKAEGGSLRKNGKEVYEARMADWRNRQVVYQVFVDRFVPGSNPKSRQSLYEPPRRLVEWNSQPKKGTFLQEAGVWQHEVDFWGGDLKGLTEKLDYIQSLGANVLYLNPIFLAYTNHKYDATDYFKIDPQYGTEEDFRNLCEQAHKRGMHIVLDGVFNHTGKRMIWFQEAIKNPNSPYRSFFVFDKNIKNGYLGWLDLENHPELNYNNPSVKDIIYRSPNSVVQHYLKQADGWRLDVAFDLGPEVLSELTTAAHKVKPDSYTVGEIYNYPAGWSPALDGVMNMYMSYLMVGLTKGKISGSKAADMIDILVQDGGIEPLLKSWIVLSNHDRPRLKSLFPEIKDRAFIQALQATLPGAPLVYYGEEIGLEGVEDPEQRGPMNWEVASSGKVPEMALTRSLLSIRNSNRALQVGDFARIPTEKLFAFLRYTSSVRETVLVVANPTSEPVTEIIPVRDPWLMDVSPMKDLLGGKSVEVSAGIVTVTVEPKTVQIFIPEIVEGPNYNRYKRVE
ncbi:MAG: glycoside hydrolase family 13 protein [Blastocatellia bacterium]|nr:glycoside hydrolase family 13 protein [Blastocatellia bacterium]